MPSPHYDPFSVEAFDNPYPLYRALRDTAPAYHNVERGFWAVSRYDDVVAVSRDWATYTVTQGVDIDNYGDVLGGGFFLAKDPPDHDKLRTVVKSAFGPRSIRELMEPEVRRHLEAVVTPFIRTGSADLAADICWKLPTLVMSSLLGFPVEDCDRLTALGLALALRDVGTPQPPPAANDAGMQLMTYFQDEIAKRRAQPRSDLLSTIANASIDGVPIGDSAEGMALLVFVGGFENVGCMLTNSLYMLATHPEQRDLLARHPDAIPRAIEEVLRFESPQQNFKRTTTREVELHGARIPAGQAVILLYGSANRDERRFERADEFDLQLERPRHLSFGEGVHFCLGSPLARLQATLLIERLMRETLRFRLLEGAQRLRSHAVRGYVNLPCSA